MIAFILGPDSFLARAALKKLKTETDPNGLNTSLMDGRSVSVEAIVAAVCAPPFFGGSRTVVVEDLLARSAKADAADDDAAPSVRPGKGAPDVARLIEATPPAHCLILFDASLGAVPAALKRTLAADVTILTHEPPRAQALLTWMRERTRRSGPQIADPVARRLLDLLYPLTWLNKPANPAYDRPPDLQALDGELEKLLLRAHPGSVEIHHVEEMSVPIQQDRLFPFVDAVNAGDLRAGVAELAVLRERGEEPNRIAVQLFQHAELMTALQSAPRGVDPATIGRDLELSNPARMGGIERGARRAALPGPTALKRSLELERGVKRGLLRGDWDSLYFALDDASQGSKSG